MSREKPKVNRKGSTSESTPHDRCQTPVYGLDPILPYIPKGSHIWEPCCGEGHIVTTLTNAGGFTVTGTDILYGENFFDWQPPVWDVIVTNPPYTVKYKWIERCLALERPFALLVPWDTPAAAACWNAFEAYQKDFEIIVITPRVNFKMPNLGYTGNGAQFSTCWLTHGLALGKQLQRVPITRRPDPWDATTLITRHP